MKSNYYLKVCVCLMNILETISCTEHLTRIKLISFFFLTIHESSREISFHSLGARANCFSTIHFYDKGVLLNVFFDDNRIMYRTEKFSARTAPGGRKETRGADGHERRGRRPRRAETRRRIDSPFSRCTSIVCLMYFSIFL